MLPDFNRLKVFHYIYTYNSVASAAKELHVTQSAVSQHLTKLEQELETKLFTRLHKKLVPTLSGDRFFELTRSFVSGLEGTLKQIQQEKEGPSGLLRIGAPVEFGERYLPQVFKRFREKYPNVSFYLELGHPTVCLPLLKQGKLDIVFADIYSKKGEYSRDLAIFKIDPVIDEKLVMVCSKVYFKEKLREKDSLETLAEAEYIAYQLHAPALRNWFKHHYKKEGLGLSVALTVESVQGVISAVKLDMGLGLIPSHLIQEEISAGRLVKIETTQKDLINRISLVQLLDKVAYPTEKVFLKEFREHMDAIGMLN